MLRSRFSFSSLVSYTWAVTSFPNHLRRLPLWGKVSTFLSFLAVVSALLAPVAMLAEDVQTGKLGGLCSAASSTAFGVAGNGAVDNEAAGGSHCDLCSSLAFAMAPFAKLGSPTGVGQQIVGLDVAFNLAARINGLPPSRGPPAW